MAKTQKPGSPAEQSGQYQAIGPRGGHVSDTEITAVEGKPLPPTDRPGWQWQLVDPTKHKP